MKNAIEKKGWKSLKTILLWAAIIGAGIASTGYFFGQKSPDLASAVETANAFTGNLRVTVVETGEIRSSMSTEIKCMVEKQSTILWVIDEGAIVKKGDKLIELDSTNLREAHTSRKKEYDEARAEYRKSREQYDIQKSQNESKISEASRKTRFALLDLKKYVGESLAADLIEKMNGESFEALGENKNLGGESLQRKRKLSSEIELAEEQHSRAVNKAHWSKKLKRKGHLTGAELQADEFAVKRQKIELHQAKTNLELFLKYEFPKDVEKFYSGWTESERELERVKARAKSELASAEAELESNRTALELEKERFENIEKQIKKTIIKAPQSGMVIYYKSDRPWRKTEEIKAGTTVRFRQTLIQLPDLTQMEVITKLHESVVKQVTVGAKAFVTADAWQDQGLTGRVSKIAVMPESNSWFTPSVKSYATNVALDHTIEGLKPGMSASVEIVVSERNNILQIPISSVYMEEGNSIVYIMTSRGPTIRRVKTGLSNDRFIEILSGLVENDIVCRYRPDHVIEQKSGSNS